MDDVETFGGVLTRWRKRRRMTGRALADAMGFDRSYISHVEHGRHPASADFARRAEAALSAGGEIWRAWQSAGGTEQPAPPAPRGSGGLVVEHDHAELRYRAGAFTAVMRRAIRNTGPDPVTRYLMRISVDRHPGDPQAANRLYRRHPLTFDELALSARCDGEEMDWQVKLDRDSFKEVWLRFENDRGRFPLYPGERATLEYAYTVGEDKWGPWFQRAVRLHTLRLSVRLVFPADMVPAVWGTHTSATAEAAPLPTPVTRRRDGDTDVFDWSTEDPPLNSRYRLEWRLREHAGPGNTAPPELRTAGDRMRAAGIVQRDDPRLGRAARRIDLPARPGEVRELVDELLAAVQRVREHHVFGKGMGLAAPQIGVDRAVAVVLPPGDDAEPLVLLNPRIIEQSDEEDERYEGCLSFFDVRGLVPRPLRLEVEHTTPDGRQVITVFTDALARLVAHEVDHLHGRLYTDRMRPGVHPIAVAEYQGTGRPWTYPG
ncbi:formylmethionine deformylase [Actinomadura craniellae]|uniref:Peptide deformylase n=1 Tax=Actinomadura craniellae TaxID=2231787 RepID=A0A365H429_9ACTN|nr:peptide deformylase [Actinomadura craniellae]RAY13768.1 formylmethionine deformylase [Actinomadura craniellae]